MPWAGRSLLRRSARSLLRLSVQRAPAESADAYLARLVRAVGPRTAGRLLAWRKQRRAKQRRARGLPRLPADGAQFAPQRSLVGALLGPAPLPEQLDLLERVFTAGGYYTADELACTLEQAVVRAARSVRAKALPIFTRIWMTTGNGERARRLWENAGRDLPEHHPWRQALWSSLGALDRPIWRSETTFYPYLAELCQRAGTLDATQLAEALAEHPVALLENPELHLLLHNAQRRAGRADLGAFNLFLERAGLLPITAQSESDNWLATLSHAPAPAASGGAMVSVIMSAYNAEGTICYAVDSILAQTHAALELLIADDASCDGTLELLQNRYAGDPRVRLFRSARNQGTYNARNQLIAQARGEWITFQDADDVSLPSRIARQLRGMRRGAVGSVSEWLRVRADGTVAFFANGRAARLSIVSFMVSRAALLSVGPYPPARVGADLDVYRRVLARYGSERVVRLSRPLLLGLWSGQSLTRSTQTESLETGYRSPIRRDYSELVFRRDLFGAAAVPDARLVEELVRAGNFAEPSTLEPVSKAASV